MAVDGDIITDFCNFPFMVYKVGAEQTYLDITADLLVVPDYWAVAREWLFQFTAQTHLQDILAIDGYSIWWTLIYAKAEPSLSDFSNSFAWIDFLSAVYRQFQPKMITIYGSHEVIIQIARQLFTGAALQIKPKMVKHAGRTIFPSSHLILLVVRVGLSIVCMIYNLLRHPDICFFSSANSIRNKAIGQKQELRDVYMGEIAQLLQTRGKRITFVERYAVNALWRGLWFRRLFFSSDLLLALSHPRLNWLVGHYYIVRKWQKVWAEGQSSLAAYMRYQEYDISSSLLPLVREAFFKAAHLESGVKLWYWLLKCWRPKLLFIDCAYCTLVTPVNIAAKLLRIPTVEQQHGIIGQNHISYRIPPHLRNKSQLPLCDFLVAWGDYAKRVVVESAVYTADNVVVCGFPRLDSLLKSFTPRGDILTRLNIPATAPVILYASNPTVQGLYPEILDSIQKTFTSPVYWIIKLHPAEKTRLLWQHAIKQRHLKQVIVIEEEVDFYTLLAAADLHISFCSTTMVEASVFGKPNLGLDLPTTLDPIGYTKAGAYLPVAPHQVGQMVNTLLQDKAQMELLLQKQEAFAKDWCRHEGKAVECTVDFIEAQLDKAQNLEA
ncbi:MAG: CDP-glycerol glycerophosphotransferase family protein [Anaerolineae bacterium]|nr:CDP-glycerol glycerophosphotransferase family protein [Anaerolineae bacterium]